MLWIPDEIWLEILEKNIPIDDDPSSLELSKSLSSLSLTCRRLRRIALPAVYHSLTFSPDREETKQGGLPLMLSVLRAKNRANCLVAQCPHLLRHVREFTLASWNLTVLGPPVPGNSERGTADGLPSEPREDWWWAAYDVVTGLISQMPGLRRLRILGSAITLQLHFSFVFHRGLNSLVLSSDNGYKYCDWEVSKLPTIPFPVEQPNPTIRSLELIGLDAGFDAWEESVNRLDYFQDIIRLLRLEILALQITVPHFPRQLSVITDLSSLRILTVDLDHPHRNYNFSPFRNVLESCPALHTLEFFSDHNWTTGLGLQDLRGDALPKLEVVSGVPEIVVPLLSGRPVHTIQLTVCNPGALDSLDIPASSAARVHALELHADIYSLLDMGTVAQFSVRFMNLVYLELRYLPFCGDGVNNPPDFGGREGVADMIVDALDQLPELLVCHMFNREQLMITITED